MRQTSLAPFISSKIPHFSPGRIVESNKQKIKDNGILSYKREKYNIVNSYILKESVKELVKDNETLIYLDCFVRKSDYIIYKQMIYKAYELQSRNQSITALTLDIDLSLNEYYRIKASVHKYSRESSYMIYDYYILFLEDIISSRLEDIISSRLEDIVSFREIDIRNIDTFNVSYHQISDKPIYNSDLQVSVRFDSIKVISTRLIQFNDYFIIVIELDQVTVHRPFKSIYKEIKHIIHDYTLNQIEEYLFSYYSDILSMKSILVYNTTLNYHYKIEFEIENKVDQFNKIIQEFIVINKQYIIN